MNKNRAINRSIVEAMETINHVHDDETGCHIRRVAAYCGLLARHLKLPPKTVCAIETYASLHDIGKIAVDLYVEYKNADVWHPWHGPVSQARARRRECACRTPLK